MNEHGLGRLPAPDAQDDKYPMRAAIAPLLTVTRTYRYHHNNAWWGNQGQFPECVGYAWAHWLEDGPVGHRGIAPIVQPKQIYNEAQKVDEWDGEGYAGTSVRAGAKVLQGLGFIAEYRWATNLQDIIDAVKYIGPIVVGTNWYSNMFDIPANNVIDVSGNLSGGHAWVLNGVSDRRGWFRAKNSWGREWGKKGSFYIKMEDVERLFNEDGEACIGIEQTH